jgi:hypothetical protein
VGIIARGLESPAPAVERSTLSALDEVRHSEPQIDAAASDEQTAGASAIAADDLDELDLEELEELTRPER